MGCCSGRLTCNKYTFSSLLLQFLAKPLLPDGLRWRRRRGGRSREDGWRRRRPRAARVRLLHYPPRLRARHQRPRGPPLPPSLPPDSSARLRLTCVVRWCLAIGRPRACLDRTLGDLPGQSSCLRPPCDRLQYCLVRQTLIPGDVWLRP